MRHSISLGGWFFAALLAGCGPGPSSEPTASVSGVVLGPGDAPLVGLTVSLAGSALSGRSGPDGSFTVSRIPKGAIRADGTIELVFDATTALPRSTFRMRMPVPAQIGVDLRLPLPLAIPVPTAGSETMMHGRSEQIVYAPEHPGASLAVPPSALGEALRQGDPIALSLTYIPRGRLPGPMPDGMVSDTVFSIQPSGLRFEEPVPITLPNYDNFAAGERVQIMQVDPDSGAWTLVGHATVNESATLIVSEPGSGVRWGSCTGCCFAPCLGTIRGSVQRRTFHPKTGEARLEPVAGARVWAGPGSSTLTAEDGSFALEQVAFGNANNPTTATTVEISARLEETGAVAREELSLTCADEGRADFVFEAIQGKLFDDENDGQRLLEGRVAGGIDGEVTTVTADGATDVRVAIFFSGAFATSTAVVRFALIPESGFEDAGQLFLDAKAGDGDAGASYAGGEIPLQALMDGAHGGGKTLRYRAPAAFGRAAERAEDGRDQRTVLLHVSIDPGDGTTVAPSEPLRIRVIRPQIFLVHGILNDRDKWALEAGTSQWTAATRAALLACPNAFGRIELAMARREGEAVLRQMLRPIVGDIPYEWFTADYGSQHMSPLDSTLPLVLAGMVELESHLRGQGIATTRFDVVGHSYGGLNLRKLIADTATAARSDPRFTQKVRKLATFGTPHLGSTLADRVLNLTQNPPLKGAQVLLDEIRTTIDNRGLFSFCGSDLSSLAALDTEASSDARDTAYDDLAVSYRSQLQWRDWGFQPDIAHRFFLGRIDEDPGFLTTYDWSYGFGGDVIGDLAHLPGDLVVARASAHAGNPFLGVDLPGFNHTEVIAPANLRQAVEWFEQEVAPGRPPAQDPGALGPVIERVSMLELQTFDPLTFSRQSYSFVIQGRNFAGRTLRFHAEDNFGIDFDVELPASAVVGNEVRFSASAEHLPHDEPFLRYLGEGYIQVEVDGRLSNRVYVRFNPIGPIHRAPPSITGVQTIPWPLGGRGTSSELGLLVQVLHDEPGLIKPTVLVDGFPALEVESQASEPTPEGRRRSTLVARIPPEATSGSVVVREGLRPRSEPVALALAPLVESLSMETTCVGEVVRLRGRRLGFLRERVRVELAGQEQPVLYAAPGEIAFVVADGATSGSLAVEVEGLRALEEPFLSVGADSDRDGMPDEFEFQHGLDAADPRDARQDPDQDQLENRDEFRHHTSPRNSDSDGGGMLDGREVALGLDPTDGDDDAGDGDGDGLDTALELTLGTDPAQADTDADQLSDGQEHHGLTGWLTDPLDFDTDDDRLSDGEEVLRTRTNPLLADTDGDGLDDADELEGGSGFTTDPNRADSDADGLSDGAELLAGTSPLDPDSDDDGLLDGHEVALGSDPLDVDSDGDGLDDGLEVALGTDPTVGDATCFLAGRVRLSNGAPAPGADVVVAWQGQRNVRTAAQANGSFVLGPWPRSLVPIEVEARFVGPDLLMHEGRTEIALLGASRVEVGDLVVRPVGRADAFHFPLADLGGDRATYDLLSSDLDGDGDLDLVLMSGDSSEIRILVRHGLGSGAFQDVETHVPRSGFQLLAGDLDGDRRPEIVVWSSFTSGIDVLWNDGTGRFPVMTFQQLNRPSGCTLGDVNGDGRGDVVAVGGPNVAFLLGRGGNAFQSVGNLLTGGNLEHVQCLDVDEDGQDEIAIYDRSARPTILLVRLVDDSRLEVLQTLAAFSGVPELLVGQLSGAPSSDLLVMAGSPAQTMVYESLPAGGFREHGPFPFPLPSACFGSGASITALLDLDGDGLDDLSSLCRPFTGGVRIDLHRNEGSGVFRHQTSLPSSDWDEDVFALKSAGDLDGDGEQDLVLRSTSRGVRVLPGDGLGSLRVPRPMDVEAYALGFGDLDLDGREDLLLTDGQGLKCRAGSETGFGDPRLLQPLFALDFELLDLDADGLLDVVVGLDSGLTSTAGGAFVCRNLGNFVLQSPQTILPEPPQNRGRTLAEAVDLDGDGRLDLVTVDFDSNQVRVYPNESGVVFGPARVTNSRATIRAASLGRIGDDATPDLLIAYSTGGDTLLQVLHGSGTAGTWIEGDSISLVEPGTSSHQVLRLLVEDLDGDGQSDAAASYFFVRSSPSPAVEYRLALLRGNPRGLALHSRLTMPGTSFLWLTARDLDGDGAPELLVTALNGRISLEVFANLGSLTFSAPRSYVAAPQLSTVLHDLDGDGRPELLLPLEDQKWHALSGKPASPDGR